MQAIMRSRLIGRRLRSSIIVVTYNQQRDIQRCLRALLPTIGPDDEVVVVDNASADGTADRIASEFPSVRLLRGSDNPGFGAACNRAARQSDAGILVFLNPDTEPRAGWLEGLIDTLRMNPRAGLVTPKLLLPGTPEFVDAFGHDVHISGIATCRGWGSAADAFTEVEEVAAVSGACFAISRQLFRDLGGFDERLFLYYEDDDLSLRARLAGRACLAVPTAVVVHDHTPGFTPAKLRYLERNRPWSLLKIYRLRTLLTLLPVMAGAEILAWGTALLSGPHHLAALLRARVELLCWIRWLGPARAKVQRQRRVGDRDLLRLHAAWLPFAQVASGQAAQHAERAARAGFSGARAIAMRLGAP